MRILFLTQWFQPEPFFKGLPFAKALAAKGHTVEVLTGFPNYPSGKVYPGYRLRLFKRETMDGIRINRLVLYPSHDKSTSRRIFNYLSFALITLLLGPWVIQRPDVVYVYNLITLGPSAFLFRLLLRSKVVIDVQDLWPESVKNSGMMKSKQALRLLNGICTRVYRYADRLVVQSPGFKRVLIDRGVHPERIAVVYNWCDEIGLRRVEDSDLSDRYGLKGKFNVLFAGSMGIAQSLENVLDCAALCQNHLANVQFVFVGDGVNRAKLEKIADEKKLENVKFLPPQPIEAMGEIYAFANATLVHLKDDPLFEITIPSKTQACLYIGKPIIMAIRGDAADLVRQAASGIICEPESPHDLMRAVKVLYGMPEEERRNMGEAGHHFYMKHLSLSQGVKELERNFISVLQIVN